SSEITLSREEPGDLGGYAAPVLRLFEVGGGKVNKNLMQKANKDHNAWVKSRKKEAGSVG
ncbi:MAG: hypothetical protein LBD32_00285, partial [Cytophagales bacterium]|nr:hypothetical protein [Cytophagales bacterium]